MTAISGTRRTIRERVDGSLIVQIEIDPPFVADFHRMFPTIDMPVALAPLRADFEKVQVVEETAGQPEISRPKGGELAKLAGMFSNNPAFHEWMVDVYGISFPERPEASVIAADFIRKGCRILSRADLDHNPEAANRFHAHIRYPFNAWLESK